MTVIIHKKTCLCSVKWFHKIANSVIHLHYMTSRETPIVRFTDLYFIC